MRLAMIHNEQSECASPSDNTLSEDFIVRALDAARTRVALYEAQRSEVEHLIKQSREEAALLTRLLDLRRGGSEQSHTVESDAAAGSPQTVVQPGTAAVAAVVDELTNAQRPLHISELMRLLRNRDVAIPGAGMQANLIVHLSRDPRFVRTARGMYALAEWGLPNSLPQRRRTRKKRVRVGTAKRKD